MRRALEAAHSCKLALDSQSAQPGSWPSAFPQGLLVCSLCCSSYIGSQLMESRAVYPEWQYSIQIGTLKFCLEWKDQLLRIFHGRFGGQILPSALCAAYVNMKLELHEFGGRVSALKNV